MEKLGLAEPFLGPLLEEFWFYNGAIIVVTPALGPLLVTEFVATLEAGLPARVDDDALWGVRMLSNTLEWPLKSSVPPVQDGLGEAILLIISDGAANHATVEGVRGADWRDVDLLEHLLKVKLDGEEVASGSSNLLLWGTPTQP